jgi:hypothetical protein
VWFGLAQLQPWREALELCTPTFGDGLWPLFALTAMAICNSILVVRSIVEALATRSLAPLLFPITLIILWSALVTLLRMWSLCKMVTT